MLMLYHPCGPVSHHAGRLRTTKQLRSSNASFETVALELQSALVAQAEAKFPLVIFSHGIGGNRTAYSAIICNLVSQVCVHVVICCCTSLHACRSSASLLHIIHMYRLYVSMHVRVSSCSACLLITLWRLRSTCFVLSDMLLVSSICPTIPLSCDITAMSVTQKQCAGWFSRQLQA